MDALNPAKRRAAQRPTPQRVYVKVTSEFDATGYMQPRAITWADGRTFAIDAVRDFRPAGTLGDRKSTRLNSSHASKSRMPSSA